MPSTKLGGARSRTGRPAARAAASGAAALHLSGETRTCGTQRLHRAGDPGGQPPPPKGTTTASDVGQVLEELQPDRAVAGDHRPESRTGGGTRPSASGWPPSSMTCHQRSKGTGSTSRAQRARPDRAWRRARSGTTPSRATPVAPRQPGHGAGHVAGAGGATRPRARLRRPGLPPRCARPAQLEAADRLQVLQLEVDLAPRASP